MEGRVERKSLWVRIFGDPKPPARLQRVLDYVVNRVQEGASLEEISREQYVRRNASTEELEKVFSDPLVVEAARRGLKGEFEDGLKAGSG